MARSTSSPAAADDNETSPQSSNGIDMAVDFAQSDGGPPVFSKPVMSELAERPPIPSVAAFPSPRFTKARSDKHGRRMPQAIAHRGYKASHPENTMCAFRSAVDVGTHALETDIHLSKDGVVVLSHDATLQRCFGVDQKIIDCEWKYLRELRTLKKPHEPMPRLLDLLDYLAQPGQEKIWLMLDIKMDNNAENVMRLMSKTVWSVSASNGVPWEERVVLGCWASKFIPLCHRYFPKFPICNIGFSLPYSRQFLPIPNVSFNMLHACLVSPSGRKFIDEVKARNRQIYSWTINDSTSMDWCIRKELDGVVTDDPKKFLELCDGFNPSDPPPSWSFMVIINFIRINIFAWIFGMLFWQKHGFGLDKRYLE